MKATGNAWVDALKQEVNALSVTGNRVYITNAGIMNHGKSSVLNSIIDQEVFKVNDVRETVKNKEYLWGDSVYVVDTPGLSAKGEDNNEAYEAYKKASLILFVHTAKIGELHKQELDEIEYIKSFFPSEDYFWKHFALIMSFKDEVSEEAMATIQSSCVASLRDHCNLTLDYVPVFFVSNRRYAKGKREHKKGLVAKSGIVELRDYIESRKEELFAEQRALSMQRKYQLCDEALVKLSERKERSESKVLYVEHKLNEERERLTELYENKLEELYDIADRINELRSDIRSLNDDISSLKDQHSRERY